MKSLDNWKDNLKKILNDPYRYKDDPNHPDCPKCKGTMSFFGPDENNDIKIDGTYWECPECGFKIYEREL